MRNIHRTKIVLSSFAVAILLSGCGEEVVVQEEKLRPVRFIEVSDAGYDRVHTYSGTSRSALISRLSFNVGGTLLDFPIDVGDTLKKGDLIGQLDSASYDLSVEQSKASLVESQANERNASSNYERIKSLYENNNASRNDLDAARASKESGAAQVDAAQKALELALLNQSYTKLRIDNNCLVASVDVQVNENVSAGQQVAQVNCGSDYEVEIDVPETVIASISKNAEVDVRFESLGAQIYTGVVTEVGIDSSGSQATYPVVVKVKNPSESIRSGLAAEVAFAEKNSQEGVLKVPASSIVNDGLGTFSMVAVPSVEDQNVAALEKRAVKIGSLTEDGVEVKEGLSAGDLVVTAGLNILRPGQQVLLDSAQGN